MSTGAFIYVLSILLCVPIIIKNAKIKFDLYGSGLLGIFCLLLLFFGGELL